MAAAFPRRGIAALEFVFSLPVLLFLAACILTVSNWLLAECSVATRARHEAWQKRETPPASARPLALLGDAAADRVSAETDGQFSKWKALSMNRHVASKTTLVTGAWDHVQVKGFREKGPHFSVLRDMAAGNVTGLASFAGSLESLRALATFNISARGALGAAGDLARALAQLEAKAEGLRATVRALRTSLAAAKQAFSGLSWLAKQSGFGRRLARRIDELTDQIEQAEDALDEINDFTNALSP